MAMLDDFITYFTELDASNTIVATFNDGESSDTFVLSTNLFALVIPDLPDNIVVINPYEGGSLPDTRRLVINPRVQILIRHTNPKAAYDVGLLLIKALHMNTTIIDGLCQSVNSNPFNVGPDDTGRNRYSVNFALKEKYNKS